MPRLAHPRAAPHRPHWTTGPAPPHPTCFVGTAAVPGDERCCTVPVTKRKEKMGTVIQACSACQNLGNALRGPSVFATASVAKGPGCRVPCLLFLSYHSSVMNAFVKAAFLKKEKENKGLSACIDQLARVSTICKQRKHL